MNTTVQFKVGDRVQYQAGIVEDPQLYPGTVEEILAKGRMILVHWDGAKDGVSVGIPFPEQELEVVK